MEYFVVIDFEFCKIPPQWMVKGKKFTDEIIQIGAVMMDEEHNELGRFNRLVRPEYGTVSPQIRRFTGISNEMLKEEATLASVLEDFASWIDGREVSAVSWSMSDHTQLMRETLVKNIHIDCIDRILGRWIDCQAIFDEKLGTTKPVSLNEALTISDIVFEGRAHDGLADAVNTARLYRRLCLEPDFRFNETYLESKKDTPIEPLAFSMASLFAGLDLSGLDLPGQDLSELPMNA